MLRYILPMFRKTDPETSRQPVSVKRVARVQKELLNYLAAVPYSAGELSELCGIPRDTVTPALNSMRKKGWVEPNGEKRTPFGRKGYLQQVWAIRKNGVQALYEMDKLEAEKDE